MTLVFNGDAKAREIFYKHLEDVKIAYETEIGYQPKDHQKLDEETFKNIIAVLMAEKQRGTRLLKSAER